MEQQAEKALRIFHCLLSDNQILHQLCLTNLSVFQMICLFEIADQMNAEDDPMLKILSAALPNLSKVLPVSPFIFSKKCGAMEI